MQATVGVAVAGRVVWMSKVASKRNREISKEKKKKKKMGCTSRQIQPLQYEILVRSSPCNGFVVLAVLFVLPSTARKKDLQAVSERRDVSHVSHT